MAALFTLMEVEIIWLFQMTLLLILAPYHSL
jgi:hypothetical protein